MTVTSTHDVSILCCNCISNLFKQDESGEISLDATKLISKMIKGRSYKVPEPVLSTFLNLRLIEEFRPLTNKELKVQNKRKSKAAHISRKSRKVIKVDDEIEKELKEAEATYDKEEKRKMVNYRIF